MSTVRVGSLGPNKPMPIYIRDNMSDSEKADFIVFSQPVSKLPTGMEKEEEKEHHLQSALASGSAIPIPGVYANESYESLYEEEYEEMPSKLITTFMTPAEDKDDEDDEPDYDMDSEDEAWVESSDNELDISCETFEKIMAHLESKTSKTVVSLKEAKALMKDEDQDVITSVFDYWLDKKIKVGARPLEPKIITEPKPGVNNKHPYLAFRKIPVKVATRKTRKIDEDAYVRMLRLRRNVQSARNLTALAIHREATKRQVLKDSLKIFEMKTQAWFGDESKDNSQGAPSQAPSSRDKDGATFKTCSGVDDKENQPAPASKLPASKKDDDDDDDEEPYKFKRKAGCYYHAPINTPSWPWPL